MAGSEEIATKSQLMGALVLRELGCALRNRTVLLTVAVVVGFCAFLTLVVPELLDGLPVMRAFFYAFVVTVPVVEVGGVIMLFAMAEEWSHGTYEVMARAGVSVGLVVAGKVVAGVVLCALIEVVVALIVGAGVRQALGLGALTAVGCIPFLLVAAGCGLCSRDEMRVNAFAFLLVVLCLVPLFGPLIPPLGIVGVASPTAFLVGSGTWMMDGSAGFQLLSMDPLALAASLAAWSVASIIWARWCIRRAER